MMRCKDIVIVGVIATAIFSACEKPEPLYPMGKTSAGLQSQIFAMGETYENQLWFDFATQKTESNAFGLWHLALSCDATPRMSVNAGIAASFGVAKFAGSSYGKITTDSLKRAKWHFDNPDGGLDSTAFIDAFSFSAGKWRVNNYTYVIDLGEKIKDSTRYVQLQITDFKGGNSYQFGYGYLSDKLFRHEQSIATNPNKNNIYYHFLSHKIVENEPFNWPDWDILFTAYKESVADDNGVFYPYVIRGVLINPKKVKVVQLDNADFNAIDLAYAQSVTFGSKQNEIGYDWKQYDQTSQRYTMVLKRVYLLKTPDAFIKLKFVDFYDDQGRKGHPKMAWEILR